MMRNERITMMDVGELLAKNMWQLRHPLCSKEEREEAKKSLARAAFCMGEQIFDMWGLAGRAADFFLLVRDVLFSCLIYFQRAFFSSF